MAGRANPPGYRRGDIASAFGTGLGTGGGALAAEGLAGAYQSAYDEARAANEQRYQDILGGHSDLYKRMFGQGGHIEGLGEQSRADILERGRAGEAERQADATARGLSGTTIAQTMRAGARRETTAELGRLEQSLMRERAGYDIGLTGGRLGFMERREDPYPESPVNLAGLLGEIGDNPRLLAMIMPLLQASYGAGDDTAGDETSRKAPTHTRGV